MGGLRLHRRWQNVVRCVIKCLSRRCIDYPGAARFRSLTEIGRNSESCRDEMGPGYFPELKLGECDSASEPAGYLLW